MDVNLNEVIVIKRLDNKYQKNMFKYLLYW